jgi:hypothetical protein
LRIKPQRGQVPENGSKPPNSEHWGVFHEHESWSYFANDSCKLLPQSAALAFDPCSLAGATNVLAGESPTHDVNVSSPWGPIEGGNIVPDREAWKHPVTLALQQDFSWVRFNLDSTDAGMSAKDAAEDSSPCSSK